MQRVDTRPKADQGEEQHTAHKLVKSSRGKLAASSMLRQPILPGIEMVSGGPLPDSSSGLAA